MNKDVLSVDCDVIKNGRVLKMMNESRSRTVPSPYQGYGLAYNIGPGSTEAGCNEFM